jgi:Radical SAM superfamily
MCVCDPLQILPISTGCLNNCTYCSTKYARGNLGSYPIEQLRQRVEQVVQEGVAEIWMSSEDTGAYGRDIGTNIVELLDSLLNALPEPMMLRVGMTNPPYILEHVEAMCRILKHPRVFSFLHIPVQVGLTRLCGCVRMSAYVCMSVSPVVRVWVCMCRCSCAVDISHASHTLSPTHTFTHTHILSYDRFSFVSSRCCDLSSGWSGVSGGFRHRAQCDAS